MVMITDTNTIPTVQESEPLSAEEIKYSNLVAQGYSYTEAYKQSHAIAESLSYQTIRTYAYRLATKVNVSLEVTKQQARLAQLAHKAVNRLDEIITEGKEHNALDASKFVYEQTYGKARQTTEVIGKHVIVSYDLSGGQAGEVPQAILDQLKDE